MLKINLTGYVNRLRFNTTPSGKNVVNVNIGVVVDKETKKYQSFDVAFWGDAADIASKLEEKDYVFIPDVIIKDLVISDGKYINISGTAFMVFKSIPKDFEKQTTSTTSKKKETSSIDADDEDEVDEKPLNLDNIPF